MGQNEKTKFIRRTIFRFLKSHVTIQEILYYQETINTTTNTNKEKMCQTSLLSMLSQNRLLQQGQQQMPQFQPHHISHLQQMMSQQMNPQMQQQQQPAENKSNNMISSDKPYVCDICGRGYSYLASLEQHKATHMTDHQHQCNGCGRLFKNKDAVVTMKLIFYFSGNETRPHQCEICGRRFTLLENLHRHQMIHTDERPFGCHYCHKRFRLAQHLKEHIRIHTGEKPYKCNICGRAFCQISNLKSHQKTHTKVKAFECDICHKTFRRSFTLKQHKLIHEREGKTTATASPTLVAPVHSHEHQHAHQGGCCGPKPNQTSCCSPPTATIVELKKEIKKENFAEDADVEVDVVSEDSDMSPVTASIEEVVQQRKEQLASPLSGSNSGSGDSGTQQKQRFYRPFEDTAVEKPIAQSAWSAAVQAVQAAGQKRAAQSEPQVDITPTKRMRDNNGKIVVYPGIRENATQRINPTSTLDELRQTTMNGPHWESLRPDQEFLWRRLGRGQDTNTVGQSDQASPEMVPVVEWRPIVVGYRSLKDGSVTNREDLPQQAPTGVKSHPFFPNMVFPSMPVSQ